MLILWAGLLLASVAIREATGQSTNASPQETLFPTQTPSTINLNNSVEVHPSWAHSRGHSVEGSQRAGQTWDQNQTNQFVRSDAAFAPKARRVGKWTTWSKWSQCTSEGQQIRVRGCYTFRGAKCRGQNVQKRPCNSTTSDFINSQVTPIQVSPVVIEGLPGVPGAIGVGQTTAAFRGPVHDLVFSTSSGLSTAGVQPTATLSTAENSENQSNQFRNGDVITTTFIQHLPTAGTGLSTAIVGSQDPSNPALVAPTQMTFTSPFFPEPRGQGQFWSAQPFQQNPPNQFENRLNGVQQTQPNDARPLSETSQWEGNQLPNPQQLNTNWNRNIPSISASPVWDQQQPAGIVFNQIAPSPNNKFQQSFTGGLQQTNSEQLAIIASSNNIFSQPSQNTFEGSFPGEEEPNQFVPVSRPKNNQWSFGRHRQPASSSHDSKSQENGPIRSGELSTRGNLANRLRRGPELGSSSVGQGQAPIITSDGTILGQEHISIPLPVPVLYPAPGTAPIITADGTIVGTENIDQIPRADIGPLSRQNPIITADGTIVGNES